MPRYWLRLGLICCLSAALVGLPGDEPRPDVDAGQKTADLILQLGHDDFSQREAANRALLNVGEPVLDALYKAEKHSDPEIRKRAFQVARSILQAAGQSKSAQLRMAVIEAGTFEMGSPQTEPNRRLDEVPHKVRITRPFLMGVYEVTQDQYSLVMQSRPSWFSQTGGGADKIAQLGLETLHFPVDTVSWFDAVEFCNRLSKQDGFTLRYEIANVIRENESIKSATVRMVPGNGYHLPTEAQWEYACRAGTSLAFHFGRVNLGKSANYRPGPPTGYGTTQSWTALQRTALVGSYPPNLFGLFDTHGNVAEWCWDWYDKDYYTGSPTDDPPGPAKGEHRILRGGSWMMGEAGCRAATRFAHAPDERKEYTGFRVARTP